MSLPPPPGSYGSVPPNGGGGPSWGGQPQQPGQPYGAPYQGQPGGQWGPPQQWAGGPPPNKGGKGKWILIGLALVAVIAVSIVGTVLVLRPDSSGGNGSTPSAQNGNSEFASANDTGPVTIITDDETCDAWGKIARGFADELKNAGWGDRNVATPASSWTSDERTMYDNVGKIMTKSADQAKNLVQRTPHRVMRELYQQFIAYNEAFVAKIPNYTQNNNGMALVINALTNATANVCSAIAYRSAQPIAPLVGVPDPPSTTPQSPSTGDVRVFLEETNPACKKWAEVVDNFSNETADWRAIDPNIPATQWSTEDKLINDRVGPLMLQNADTIEQLGRDSGNPVFEDFATLSAQYRRGYVMALPTYTQVDNFLAEAASQLVGTVHWACKATMQ
ncbi:hypothetical protein H5U98_00300 [Mycolicibacterium boenickei]|uniref:Uncharacterized protein n=1 Tax=Mycolicibacterium boenickei TaxID=146017 RepID=A0AAX2ZWW3_9MYCO|nr:hypothetical protein [Mycolicibacterium boenickei]PEG58280.1 hypothetical protein CQY21_23270 [Mycolicibacterium boenickei]UNB99945.1 hypothetical protein H5U98_00300 [Mycolicibacterium boenickei]BBX89634.1 hypothetical protein MBOE_12830 [Mycolicibacterium boenickei]